MLALVAALALSVCVQKSFAQTVTLVSFSGQFTNSLGTFSTAGIQLIPIGGTPDPITFAFNNGTITTDEVVAFTAVNSGTTIEANGETSQLVTISYASLFGTGFLTNSGIFNFDGETATNALIPIDAVVSYTMAAPAVAGWTLTTPANAFPTPIVGFSTSSASLGAPNGASFELDYSIPDSNATWVLVAGAAVCLLFWKQRQNQTA